jgi:hypothetical protein
LPDGGTLVTRGPNGEYNTVGGGGVKPTTKYKEFQESVRDGFKGDFNQWLAWQANLNTPRTVNNFGGEQKTYENSMDLRNKFTQEPVYKNMQEMNRNYKEIKNSIAMASPAGDYAVATKFVKLLDPTSVARESEVAQAMKATGKLDKLENYVQNTIKGTTLNPAQRADFHALAKEYYNGSADLYNSKRNEYDSVAKGLKLNTTFDVDGKKAHLLGEPIPMLEVGDKTQSPPVAGQAPVRSQNVQNALDIINGKKVIP